MTKRDPDTHKLASLACLNCGTNLDAATGVGHHNAPKPGSITICIRCGHIMAFSDQMTFRELNDDEIKDVAGLPQILAAQWAILNRRKECSMPRPMYGFDEDQHDQHCYDWLLHSRQIWLEETGTIDRSALDALKPIPMVRYRFMLTCPKCFGVAYHVQPHRIPPPCSLNCGDCLMNYVEVIELNVVKVEEVR